MNVTLVPFGNAKYTSTGELSCQHGPDECEANSYEQCVIAFYPEFERYFPFYKCVEADIDSQRTIPERATQCAEQASLDVAKIKACVSDRPRAAALQKKFQGLTPSNHK